MAIVLLALLCGCARYRPLPLTRQAVDRQLEPPPVDQISVAAAQIKHPLLRPIAYDPKDGLSPDELAVLAVLVNPRLRAMRDRRQLAGAQLLQAQLLPNPQVGWSSEFPTGGIKEDTVSAYGVNVNWDILSLVGYGARVDAAATNSRSVALDVGWQEWIVAEAAKGGVYALVGLKKQAALAARLDDQLQENLTAIQRAVAGGIKTELDLAAAEAASSEAHAAYLDLQSQVALQQIELSHLLGLPADSTVPLQATIELPSELAVPPAAALAANLENRRLDLVALRYGYQSQEATLRAAVLAQFPRVNLGVLHGRDTDGVASTGFGISVDLPLFDRNQGVIARACATRKQLFDEYVNRYYETTIAIAKLQARIAWLNRQIAASRQAEAKQHDLVDIYEHALAQGQTDVVVYYAARAALTKRQIQTVTLRQALVLARIDLELAAGVYDINSLGSVSRPEAPHPDPLPLPFPPAGEEAGEGA